jgi:outer membrane protein TolC
MKRSIYIIFIYLALYPALTAAQEEAPNDSLSLYLAVAAENNPDISAARLAAEAALEKLPQAGAYPDPTLEAGVFTKPMELAMGRQVAQFQLMQMFPWFGARKAARTEAQYMANMAFEELREVEGSVLLDVRVQWYALCAAQQKLANSESNRQWLKHVERLALGKYVSPAGVSGNAYAASPSVSPSPGANTVNAAASASGGMGMKGMNAGSADSSPVSGMTDMETGDSMQAAGSMNAMGGGLAGVLQIQLEAMELESLEESIRDEIKAGKARLNLLMNRPADSPVSLPDSLVLIPFAADVESLMNEISENNPLLAMLREEALAYGAKAEMDRKMGYPMFGAGLQYMLMAPLANSSSSSMEGMNESPPAMNGKDMLMPMISVSIPLYRRKYNAARTESLLRQEAAAGKHAGAMNRLEAELRQSVYRMNDAGRRLDLYRRQSATARTAAGIALQEFVSGDGGLESVISILRRLSDYQLKEAEAIAEYNTAVASIKKLVAYNIKKIDP